MKKSVCDVSRMLAGLGIIASLLLSGVSQGWAQQTAAISKNQLIGAWTLVSWESVTKDGTKEPTMEGATLKGLLIFDAGRFSLQVISEYPKLASRDRMKTTPEENKAVAHGVLWLFGTYSVTVGPHRVPRVDIPATRTVES